MTEINKIKIIFLDIDGVLNVNRRQHDQYGQLFHPEFVDNLKFIVDNTLAKIVISSTWRLSGIEVMREMWQIRNLPGEIIGVTGRHETGIRGIEIEQYLEYMGFKRASWNKETQIKYLENSVVSNYIVIDEDSDMRYYQKEHFIKTSCNYNHPDSIEGYGLTKLCAYKAIKTLNTPILDLYFTID